MILNWKAGLLLHTMAVAVPLPVLPTAQPEYARMQKSGYKSLPSRRQARLPGRS